MKRKLTDLGITRIKKPMSGRLEVWDTVLPAFGLRITATGARTWIVAARRPGKKHPVRLKIGEAGEPPRGISLAEARAKARQVMEGGAPTVPVTFKELAGRFLEHGRTKRGRQLRAATLKEYRRALLVYAAPLHPKPVRDIRRGEVASLIREVAAARGSTSAMRTRAALSRLWGWMVASDLVQFNVVTGTEGYSTPKRSRVLSDGELRVLWQATAEPSDFSLILRLMLWTGCRRGEAGGIAWPELVDGIWTVPGERTKNHRPLVLPLPRQALAAIEAWPRIFEREHLFGRATQEPGENELKERGFQGWSRAKARLDAQIGWANAERRLGRPLAQGEHPAKEDAPASWDLHDIRRSVETRMAGLRIPKDHVNKILNHADGPVTAAYDQWSYLPEKAAALQIWADELERITSQCGEQSDRDIAQTA